MFRKAISKKKHTSCLHYNSCMTILYFFHQLNALHCTQFKDFVVFPHNFGNFVSVNTLSRFQLLAQGCQWKSSLAHIILMWIYISMSTFYINVKDDNSLKPNQHLGVHSHFFEKTIISVQWLPSLQNLAWSLVDRLRTLLRCLSLQNKQLTNLLWNNYKQR